MGRKSVLTDEERKKRRKEYRHNYYLNHKEECNEASKNYAKRMRAERPLEHAKIQLRYWQKRVAKLEREQEAGCMD